MWTLDEHNVNMIAVCGGGGWVGVVYKIPRYVLRQIIKNTLVNRKTSTANADRRQHINNVGTPLKMYALYFECNIHCIISLTGECVCACASPFLL